MKSVSVAGTFRKKEHYVSSPLSSVLIPLHLERPKIIYNFGLSECYWVKGTRTVSAVPYQKPQNSASDHALHFMGTSP